MIDVSGVCPPEVHEAIKADPVRWAQLTPCARRFVAVDYGDGGDLELHEGRNCACTSTLLKVTTVRACCARFLPCPNCARCLNCAGCMGCR